MHASELQTLLDMAVESAQLAGSLTLGYFHSGVTHELKADRSPVTAADRGAEMLIRERIEKYYPTHGIVGEEFGVRRGTSDVRWILDPIDGTFSFIHGVPLYSTLIGIEIAGRVDVGVIHLPALSETVYAARGLGARWNGRPARVSTTEALSEATLLTGGGTVFDKTDRSAHFDRMRRACRVHRSWCDGYGYALVATGRADVSVDPKMELWDIAALIPVIEEAGGRVTSWAGGDALAAGDIAATNGRLHQDVLTVLGSV